MRVPRNPVPSEHPALIKMKLSNHEIESSQGLLDAFDSSDTGKKVLEIVTQRSKSMIDDCTRDFIALSLDSREVAHYLPIALGNMTATATAASIKTSKYLSIRTAQRSLIISVLMEYLSDLAVMTHDVADYEPSAHEAIDILKELLTEIQDNVKESKKGDNPNEANPSSAESKENTDRRPRRKMYVADPFADPEEMMEELRRIFGD